MFDIETKREVAKLGMVATLGLTVATALKMKGKNKKIHTGAGFAFVGFAFWHHMLYQNKKPNKAAVSKGKENKNKKSPQAKNKPQVITQNDTTTESVSATG